MKKLTALLLILILSVGIVPVSFAAGKVTIYVAGDSTAQSYDAGRAPLTGWAQKLQDYMPDGITVANHAMSGRSSKSFIDEGRLRTILNGIKKGDYFLIQFGHNDQSNEEALATETNTTFKEYLMQYIDGAREKGATPILLSPMERRRFDKNGKAVATLADRAQAMKELAQKENIPFIDVEAETLRWWNYLGTEGTKDIFLHLDSGEYNAYPGGIADDTHLCEYGALQVAKLVASKLGELDIDIADKLQDISSPIPAEAKSPDDEKKENSSSSPSDNKGETSGETILAEEEYTAIETDSVIYRNAAKEAQSYGIMSGYADGSLGEKNPISRAETAALLSRVFNLNSATPAAFYDVTSNHWALDSISALSNKGIISGYNGYFYPDNTVSYGEMTKMLVEAFGYGARATQIGEYPYGYLTVAAELGISKDIDLTPDESVTRGIAAKMLINSLRIRGGDGTAPADRLIKNTYYISENGSDEDDGSYENPWLTLAAAAGKVKDGDKIIINPGSYDEVETAEFAANNVKIRCTDTGNAKFVYPPGKGISVSGKNVTVSGISFDVKTSSGNSENYVISITGEDAQLTDCDITGSGVLLSSAKNAKIYNNIFRDSENSQAAAISVVDGSDGCSIWNNSVISEGYGAIGAGIKIVNANDCRVFNNTVIGTANGVYFGSGNNGITLRNNIFSDCSMDAYSFEEHPKKFNSDYNVFSNTYPRVWERNSSYSAPLFDDQFSDWRITAKSPAAGTGEDLSYSGLDFTDRYGVAPEGNWNIGSYQKMSDKIVAAQTGSAGKLLYSENFTKELTDWENWGGSWKSKDGVLQQITVGGRTLATYNGGYDWGNYFYSADVISPMLVEGNTTGIVFRSDKSMENFYTLRIYEDTHLEFAVWRDGVFESLDKWEYKTESETLYNLAVRANGSSFTFYVNGDEVKTCSDNSHETGSVGCYAYRQMGEFDNVKVEAIR